MPDRRPRVAVVTGGLGYIGQSLVHGLQAKGQQAVIIDIRNIASQVSDIPVFRGSVGQSAVWDAVCHTYTVDAVYHCAGYIAVEESVRDPARYFSQNIVESLRMLDYLRPLRVPLIFSSSAAVYGIPTQIPIPETASKQPLSPYGLTKWHFEQVLEAYGRAYGLDWMALRYFNAAGSIGEVRECHQPETHVLPRMAVALAEGRAPIIYGREHPTPDGTAIRDYVHVADLVEAHVAAAQYLAQGGTSQAVNLGSGRGSSVAEIVAAFAQVSGRPVMPHWESARPGDPPALVADISLAAKVLKWQPQYSGLEPIVSQVWELHRHG